MATPQEAKTYIDKKLLELLNNDIFFTSNVKAIKQNNDENSENIK